ncbi:MAG: GH25 family lysozyme, partial [Gaiellaceae bacterium]
MGVTVTRRVTALLVLAAALVGAGPAGAAVKGADVSHWQGTVDWLRVANAGYSFAFLKATEGPALVDPTYPINRADATTFGIRTGAYHFARPSGSGDAAIVASAIAQADSYVTVAGLQPGDLPPALDLEATGGLSPAALTTWTQAWLDEVTARTGVKAVVYFSPNFWKKSLADTTTFAQQGFRVWIAHWKVAAPAVPAANWGGSGWTFWQWTNCETIPGFLHCVDGDRFAGASLSSVAVPSFPAAVPSQVTAPSVVGAPQVGTLTAAVPGAWNGGRPISFAYQWQSCDAAGGGCVPIPGATGESYTPA